ncbi:tetratricopeptide repeat protein [Shewanella sp. D64]|uniref:tetratricopeptide repeat protein n=1 Tax=unclassified Shewanella TaxID=196818 RepID=UPI0022BA62D4|nr:MULTISPECIES: tetratricopeptide repeat protein [unclassified Shewanella]MEC4725442.1 tetratricopeptide repeat protein [Shewanella sp. D64]MEC4738741.1 tetratricopeptide repeat protein [Shewanella sp. E94]WBJ95033.1 tetratricopeptide repeat protein [Shewanella sp. MTB7]
MSVINTMLKDLDKRQQAHSLENMNTVSVQYRSRPSPRLPWILLALVCLVFICAVAYKWETLTQSSSSQQTELIESRISLLPKPIAVQSLNVVNANESGVEQETLKQSVQLNALLVERVDVDHESKAQVVKPVLGVSAPPVTVKEPIETETSKQVNNKTVTTLEDTAVVSALKPVSTPKVDDSFMAITEVRLSNSELAKKRFQLGTQAEDQGDQRDAIEYYQEALSFSPQLHKARERLAALYYGQGNLNQASNTLKQGTALFPQKFDYLMLLARVQQAAGKYEDALDSLNRIPDGSSLSQQKWIQESSIGQKVKNYTLAEGSYRKLLQAEATQSRWWMGLAYVLDAQQKYAIAIEAYRQALFYKAVPKQGLSVQAVDYIETRLVQLGEDL